MDSEFKEKGKGTSQKKNSRRNAERFYGIFEFMPINNRFTG